MIQKLLNTSKQNFHKDKHSAPIIIYISPLKTYQKQC